MRSMRGKLTYANVVATLALFIALAGGTAFAASQVVPKNSVGTKQVKKSAITTVKIKNGAVTAAKLAPGSVGGAAVKASTLPTVPSATDAAHASSADSATRAASAGHADSADSATVAGRSATADNALTLGGQTATQLAEGSKLKCPSGTKLEMGLCFETRTRTPTLLGFATFACQDDERWLPNIEQIISYQQNNTGTAAQPEEWSDEHYRNGESEDGYTAHVTGVGTEFAPRKGSESKAFRCVTNPTN